MVYFFLDVARRVERRLLAHQAVPLGNRALYRLGLVYGPLRDNLGMRLDPLGRRGRHRSVTIRSGPGQESP